MGLVLCAQAGARGMGGRQISRQCGLVQAGRQSRLARTARGPAPSPRGQTTAVQQARQGRQGAGTAAQGVAVGSSSAFYRLALRGVYTGVYIHVYREGEWRNGAGAQSNANGDCALPPPLGGHAFSRRSCAHAQCTLPCTGGPSLHHGCISGLRRAVAPWPRPTRRRPADLAGSTTCAQGAAGRAQTRAVGRAGLRQGCRLQDQLYQGCSVRKKRSEARQRTHRRTSSPAGTSAHASSCL